MGIAEFSLQVGGIDVQPLLGMVWDGADLGFRVQGLGLVTCVSPQQSEHQRGDARDPACVHSMRHAETGRSKTLGIWCHEKFCRPKLLCRHAPNFPYDPEIVVLNSQILRCEP